MLRSLIHVLIRVTLVVCTDQAFSCLEMHSCCAGASGGVASTYRTIAPQFVPIPQLILMTMKAAKELEAE